MKNAKLKLKLGICGVVGALAVSLAAYATQQLFATITIPGDLTWVTTATSNSTSGTAFDIPQNTDLIFYPTVHASGASTSNVTYGFDLTPDGTNWTTSHPVSGIVVLTGATSATGYIYISRTNLTGAKQLRLGSVSTPSVATITNDAMRVSYTY